MTLLFIHTHTYKDKVSRAGTVPTCKQAQDLLLPPLTGRERKERQQEEERKVCARHTERKVWKVSQCEKTLAISQGCRRLREINELRRSVEWQSLQTQTEKKRRGGGKSGLTQWLPAGSISPHWYEVKHFCERGVTSVCDTQWVWAFVCLCLCGIRSGASSSGMQAQLCSAAFVLNRSGTDWHHSVHRFLSSFPPLLLSPSPPFPCLHSCNDVKWEQLVKYQQRPFPQTEHFSCYK